MNLLFLLCVVCVTFRGLCEGSGVLVDDLLNATVGGKVIFTTTLTPPVAISIVIWNFGINNIITMIPVSNTTDPGYEGRITLFIPSGSLELRNLALNDSGDYGVNIIVSGEAQSGNSKLMIYEPVSNVTITTSSRDLEEFISSVRLSCSSSGSSLSFLWLNGSSKVTDSDRVQLTDGGSNLTISNVTRYDQGPFRCRVVNPASNGTSVPVQLSISFGPENTSLNLSPTGHYYEDGSNVSLTCSAVSRPPAHFQWIGDELSVSGPELRLLNINMNHTGNYSCQAFNNKTMRNQTSQPAFISVLKRISGASVQSTTNQAVEGNSVNLTCEAAGSVFSRQWMKDGSDLIPTDYMTLNSEESVLSFQPLKKTHSGEYSCSITNPINSEEADYTLVVNYGPESLQITGPREINVKHTLTLTCSAESTPSATYTWWLLNTREILSYSAVFTKDVTEFSDSGSYSCRATNIVTGRTSTATHVLSVTVKPPPSCSSGCIAGIIIACCLVVGLFAGGWYFVSQRKKQLREPFHGDIRTGSTGSGSQYNAATSSNQNKDGGTVQLELEKSSSENAEVKKNNRLPAASSTDAHVEQMKDADPQSGANCAPADALDPVT